MHSLARTLGRAFRRGRLRGERLEAVKEILDDTIARIQKVVKGP